MEFFQSTNGYFQSALGLLDPKNDDQSKPTRQQMIDELSKMSPEEFEKCMEKLKSMTNSNTNSN